MSSAVETTAATAIAAISTRGVARDFTAGQQTIRVLHGIDLDVRAGELTYLVGESGSGKTTLISIMCGILWPTEGEVRAVRHRHLSSQRQRTGRFPAAQCRFHFPAI